MVMREVQVSYLLSIPVSAKRKIISFVYNKLSNMCKGAAKGSIKILVVNFYTNNLSDVDICTFLIKC